MKFDASMRVEQPDLGSVAFPGDFSACYKPCGLRMAGLVALANQSQIRFHEPGEAESSAGS
jgi:hypothetical protein